MVLCKPSQPGPDRTPMYNVLPAGTETYLGREVGLIAFAVSQLVLEQKP